MWNKSRLKLSSALITVLHRLSIHLQGVKMMRDFPDFSHFFISLTFVKSHFFTSWYFLALFNQRSKANYQAVFYLGGLCWCIGDYTGHCLYWMELTSPSKFCQLCFHIFLQGQNPKWNPTQSPVILSPFLLAESPLSLAICRLCYMSPFWASLPQIPFKVKRPEVQLQSRTPVLCCHE